MALDTMTRHLSEAVRELLQQRSQIDRDLADLQRMLRERGVSIDVLDAAELMQAQRPSVAAMPVRPSLRDAILATLGSEDRDWTKPDVVSEIHALGLPLKDSSIGSTLSRMLRDNIITTGSAHGTYRARLTGERSSVVTPDDGSGVTGKGEEEM